MLWCSSVSSTANAASKRFTMTPHANAARWRPRAKPLWTTRATKGLVCGVCLLIAAQYLAGYLFLWWVRADPKMATPLTIVRYGYYYGARADIHRKLWLSSAAGLALVFLGALPAMLPRRRSLHGDAR